MPENGAKTDENRLSNGQFAPGNKGGGRPRKPTELKKAADDALMWLIKMLNDPKTNDKLRADIAGKLYEWQYGKATQRVAGDGEESAIRIEMPDAIRELAK